MGPMGLAAFPPVDHGEPGEPVDRRRERLAQLGQRVRPVVLARDRAVALSGGLAGLVPGGALARGSVVRVDAAPGAGGTSVAFELAAAVTAAGEWAVAVDPDATLGALAARDAGVALDRFAVVRRVPPARWATVVAALLDGVSLVLADVPRGVRAGDAHRLVARAREREAILVVHAGVDQWPTPASLTLQTSKGVWTGIDDAGFVTGRTLVVHVGGRGAAARPRVGEHARAV